MFAPQDRFLAAAAPVAAPATAEATRAPWGFFASATASAMSWAGCSMPRFTPERTTGFPANRFCSRTSTSLAKITASASSMIFWSIAW